MEQRTATIPFDLETAKKINIGEIAGRIVTEKGRNRAEIVYEDNSSIYPLLVVIHSISVSADWFSATGKAISSENRLLLEVPEYITFKIGPVLRAARPSRGTWSSPVASRAPATSTSETWFGR